MSISDEPEVIVILDRAGYICFITAPPPSYQGGRKPEELIGHHISEFVHPDDFPLFEDILDYDLASRRGGIGGRHFIIRIRRLDKAWHWMEVEVPDFQGRQFRDHVILFIRDVTALWTRDQQFRQAENVAGYGVWAVRRGSPYADLSAGFVKLLGFDRRDPATEKKFWPLRLLDRKDAKMVLATLRQVIDRPQEFSFTCAIHTKKGARRIIKTKGQVSCDAAGRDTIFGVSMDVTAVTIAEAKLRASEQQYRLLTQRASDIICQLSPAGIIEFISPSVLRLTGCRPSRLVGSKFIRLLPEQEHSRFERFLENLKRGEEDSVCTVRFHGVGSGESWLELSGRTVKNHAGQVSGLVCIGRDISERKEFELQLDEARRKAEELSASKSKFLSLVSHELRTPLNAILGFAELIRDRTFGTENKDQYAEYGALIHESGVILNSLVNDLLDLSKIEAGRFELHEANIALKDIVPLCVQQIGPLIMKKKITVKDGISGMNLTLRADRKALMHILINLLSNAAKFTSEGGRIDLIASQRPGRLRLSVRDTGIGIRKEDIARVTDPFEQVVAGQEGVGNGTGLGLALAKSLIELHGGELIIQSEPGEGTTVSVDLPADSVEEAAA